jgi:hypothetical protein
VDAGHVGDLAGWLPSPRQRLGDGADARHSARSASRTVAVAVAVADTDTETQPVGDAHELATTHDAVADDASDDDTAARHDVDPGAPDVEHHVASDRDADTDAAPALGPTR